MTEKKEFSFVPGCPATFLDAAGEYSCPFRRQAQISSMHGRSVGICPRCGVFICPAPEILSSAAGKSSRKMGRGGGIFLLLNYEYRHHRLLWFCY